MRTDRNRNPAAITTDVARQGGLIEGKDFIPGDPFPSPSPLVTAKLLGDPVALTIRVIDQIGFYTQGGSQRWTYIGIPSFVWTYMTYPQKVKTVGFMYGHEGGTEMKGLFGLLGSGI